MKVGIEVDPDRLRPSDVEILIGDSTKFRNDTGWTPRIPLEQTVDVILADSLNVVDLLKADVVVIEQPALARMEEVYA